MRRITKMIVAVCMLSAVAISGTTVRVSAAATDLPAGVLIGDQEGIKVSVDGEYFIDWVGLEAGDTLTKTLTIRNLEPYAYKISMAAEPMEETGPLSLLKEVDVQLVLDGQELYNGRVKGDEGVNMILNALSLGEYTTNQSRTLQINMKVSDDMKKHYWTVSEAWFKWNFYAARAEDGKLDGPKTGEIVTYALYGLCSVILLAGTALVVVKKKQKEKAAAKAES